MASAAALIVSGCSWQSMVAASTSGTVAGKSHTPASPEYRVAHCPGGFDGYGRCTETEGAPRLAPGDPGGLPAIDPECWRLDLRTDLPDHVGNDHVCVSRQEFWEKYQPGMRYPDPTSGT